MVKNFWGFLLTGGLLIVIILISKIPVQTVLKGIKPLLFIIVFTAFFNIFYGTGAPVFPDIGWLAWLKWGWAQKRSVYGNTYCFAYYRYVIYDLYHKSCNAYRRAGAADIAASVYKGARSWSLQ